jgi:hypothetical protein
MTKYTIQSISEEGIYFLVNGWNKHKAIWVTTDKLENSMLFNTPAQAKASLTKLLKVMPEYSTDSFAVAEFDI